MDKDSLGKFIKMLCEGGDRSLVVQTFGEGSKKGERGLTRVLTGGSAHLISTLTELNKNGGGIFSQINGGKGRGAKHIKTVRMVFLDLDGPSPGPVRDAIKSGALPRPRMLVESSPGRYHFYWRAAVLTNQFGQIQKALAARYDGDMAVHNLDRVMRVPGTVNYKYSDDGFKVRIVKEWMDAPVCTAEDFLDGHSDAVEALEETEVDYSSLVDATGGMALEGYSSEPAMDVKELKPGDRTQKIIRMAGALVTNHPNENYKTLAKLLMEEVDKRTPDEAAKVSSDSWNGEILPGLKRFVAARDAEVKESKESIDKDIHDYGDEFEAYREASENETLTLKDFAERFVLVSTSQQVYDLKRSPAQQPMSIQAFQSWAKIYTVEGSPIFNKWIKSKQLRRTVAGVTYKPYAFSLDERKRGLQRIVRDELTGQLCINTYAPPELTPRPCRDDIDSGRLNVFLEHIDYLFEGNKDKAGVFLDWLAATVQRPERRVTWAPLIVTTYEGVGKGWIDSVVRRLIGGPNYRKITQDALGPNAGFNDFLASSKLVVLDEVMFGKRTDFKNRLNAMITEDALEVNRKHGSKRMERIYANFICFSNHKNAIKLSVKDRRFWVHLMERPPQGPAYYNKLWAWLKSEGPSLLLHHLLKRDISKFNFGQCPRLDDDKAKREMALAARTEIEQALDNMVEDREGPFKFKVVCRKFLEDWFISSTDIEVDKYNKSEFKGWLRNQISLGRIAGVPSQYRLETFYLILDDKQKQIIKTTQQEEKIKLQAKGYLRKNISAIMATIYGGRPVAIDLNEGDDK